MIDSAHVLQVVLVSAAITWALRALPFVVLAPLRSSAIIAYLSVHMPLGVMVMLALYTVHSAHLTHSPQAAAFAAAVLVTLGLHLRWGHMLLSIFGGTAVHVVLATALN